MEHILRLLSNIHLLVWDTSIYWDISSFVLQVIATNINLRSGCDPLQIEERLISSIKWKWSLLTIKWSLLTSFPASRDPTRSVTYSYGDIPVRQCLRIYALRAPTNFHVQWIKSLFPRRSAPTSLRDNGNPWQASKLVKSYSRMRMAERMRTHVKTSYCHEMSQN